MSRENGDYRVALVAGFIFMLILSWFPPFGIIIAGFLTGFISEKAKEGGILGAILAAVGALIQITFVSKILPILGLGISVLGLGGPALFSLYCILGALGGFFGGLVR